MLRPRQVHRDVPSPPKKTHDANDADIGMGAGNRPSAVMAACTGHGSTASAISQAPGQSEMGVVMTAQYCDTGPFRRNMPSCFLVGLPPSKPPTTAINAMPHTDPTFLAFLEEQRANYRRSLPRRLADIAVLWLQILSGKEQAQALASLERHAHSLAGSSATFGLTALGEAAQVLELIVNPLVEPGASLTEETKAKVGLAIQALQRHLPAQGPEDSV